MTAPPCPNVRLIALGNELASDDGAALRAARVLADSDPELEVILAGRPGTHLLELLDPAVPTVLLDVVRLGCAAGSVIEVALANVAHVSTDGTLVSSHDLGVAPALRLAEALGRPLPRGIFVGIGGRRFKPGCQLDPDVARGVDDLVDAARGAIEALRA